MHRKKDTLLEMLDELALCMEINGENDFKIRAYKKGAQALLATPESLEDVASKKVKISGIGDGLIAVVAEYLKTGEIAELAKMKSKIAPVIFDLMDLPGLGAKKAVLLHEELGVQSIGELEYACRENRLAQIKGFGQAMQAKVLKAIEEKKQNQGKIRIDQALELCETLEPLLSKKLNLKKITRVGAVARMREVVDHVEFVVEGPLPSPKSLASFDTFFEKGREIFSRSETIAVFKLDAVSSVLAPEFQGLRCTLWFTNDSPSAEVLHWLAASEEVRAMVKTEAELQALAKAETTWLEPEWFIARRIANPSTYRRKRDGHVQGIFHCHTNFSDGVATLDEMVLAAEKIGYQYIGISDHSQSSFYAQGLKIEKLLEQRDLIQKLQKKVKIKIFHGIESDILADGALDYPEKVLANFDFIVGSIHNRFQMQGPEMTKRIVTALKHPRVTIWGHPTGRLLLGRKAYDIDWDQCIDAAAQNGVAVEFNANPQRLDVDWRQGELLEKKDVWVCINPDAHSVDGISDTVYGEAMAEKAMVSRERILNLKSLDQIEEYLWQRKQKN